MGCQGGRLEGGFVCGVSEIGFCKVVMTLGDFTRYSVVVLEMC